MKPQDNLDKLIDATVKSIKPETIGYVMQYANKEIYPQIMRAAQSGSTQIDFKPSDIKFPDGYYDYVSNVLKVAIIKKWIKTIFGTLDGFKVIYKQGPQNENYYEILTIDWTDLIIDKL